MLVCPFLSRLSCSSLVKSEAQRLLTRVGPQCPVFGKLLSSKVEKGNVQDLRCPFIRAVDDKDIVEKEGSKVTNVNMQELVESVSNNTSMVVPENCAFHQMMSQIDKDSKDSLPSVQVRAKPKIKTSFNYDSFFEKEIDKKKKDSSYRVFKKILRNTKDFPYAEERSMGNRKVAVWCSNDYLGMSWHPRVMQSAYHAIRKHGTGSGGTRNISGNTILHENLENDLARLHGKESALVFTSCYVANESTLHTLGSRLPNVEILSDSANHASMIHGIRTSMARKTIFQHNNVNHLDRLLSEMPESVPKIVAFETVHSMTGDISPISDLLTVCENHGAFSFVDEVHAVGLYGKHGAGVAERDGLVNRIDLISGTLGKAYGNIGGYVAGDKNVIDMVRNYASGFIFTTSLPPSVLAAARTAIHILASDEGRQLRANHQEVVSTVKGLLIQEGIPVIDCPSHIIPIHVGDPRLCTHLSNQLLQKYNIYVQAINHPTVAWGEERLRLAPSPHHTLPMIQELVSALVNLWHENNVPFVKSADKIKAVAA